jgi:cullin 3
MMQFRDCILRKAPDPGIERKMLEILNTIILEQVAMERDGDIIDKTLIKSCVYMLEALHESVEEAEDERLYLTSFEKGFLDASRVFYKAEGDKLIAQADAATYCRHTLDRISEEQRRCTQTLSEATTPKIVAVVEDELIKNKMHDLIAMDSGVKHMVDHDQFDVLELVFNLNSRIDTKKAELTQAIQRRVQEVGQGINEAAMNTSQAAPASAAEKAGGEAKPTANAQTTAALQWVEAILQLKEKYDHLWEKSFQSDAIIQPALTKSFTDTINAFPRSAECISLFIDENMKKGLKDKTEAEVEVVLNKAIVLLRYIQDKDMFERYYKKHLCKRLLMGKSISMDVEKQMVMKMKIELGNSSTNKLEAMFKDMNLSGDLTSAYRTRVVTAAEAKRTELDIKVLTSMTWPLETMQSDNMDQEQSECIFPPEIERIKKGFENFYSQQHNGRKLKWMSKMGTADIRAVFPKVQGAKEGTRLAKERKYELNVSTYAMVVLLLFNDVAPDASLSFQAIQDKTGIPTSELIRNLQALAVSPKTRILIKEPMSKDVKPTDRFSFNTSYSSQFLRVKVGVVAAGNKVEGEKERRDTEKRNNDSRGFSIEAAIVRIMKQRKELGHQQLVAETVTQLASQFKPDIAMIKSRIESLIEREYLERIDGREPQAYRYLA